MLFECFSLLLSVSSLVCYWPGWPVVLVTSQSSVQWCVSTRALAAFLAFKNLGAHFVSGVLDAGAVSGVPGSWGS